MFGMGMGELLVILAVALLVLGPQRLPQVASGLGKAIREFRRATRDLQEHIEVDESVSKPFQELKAALNDPVLPPLVPRSIVTSPSAPAPLTAGATPAVSEAAPATKSDKA